MSDTSRASQASDSSQTSGSSKDPSKRFATEPLRHLMPSLAIPTIAAQLAVLLYNMIDRMLIGHVPVIGADALSGLGICMPLVSVIAAFAQFAAAGGAPLCSIELGRRDYAKAQKIMIQTQTLMIAFGIFIMAVIYAFMEPLLYLFGASDTTIVYAAEYMRVYLLATFFIMVSIGMNLFLLAQGRSTDVLISACVGAFSHVALALLFIFVFNWGVAGAAASSVISLGFNAVLMMYFLRRPGLPVRLLFKIEPLELAYVKRILSVGSGRFVVFLTDSIMIMVVNSTMRNVGGDTAVGVMTILFSLQKMAFTPARGFTQGTQAVISYCYGAQNPDRAEKAIKIVVGGAFSCSAILVTLILFFPAQAVGLFTQDETLAAEATNYIGLFCMMMIPFGVQSGLQSTFQALGKGFCSLTVAAVRKVVFYIPAVLVFSQFWGVTGVIAAEPFADTMSLIFVIALSLYVIPHTIRPEKKKRN